MNRYLISSKEDDYGASNKMVITCKLKDIKNKVYYYTKITEKEYIVLKKYLGEYNEYYDNYNYIEEYFG